MSREGVRLEISAILGLDDAQSEHRRLYELLIERVYEVVNVPEFEPIAACVQTTGLYWYSDE